MGHRATASFETQLIVHRQANRPDPRGQPAAALQQGLATLSASLVGRSRLS